MSIIASRKRSLSAEVRGNALNSLVNNVASVGQSANQAGDLFINGIPLDQIEFDDSNPRVMLNRDNPELIDPSDPEYDEKRELLEHCQTLALGVKELGFYSPVIVKVDRNDRDKYHLIAGHCRWFALKIAGWTHAPAVEMNHLTPEQVDLLRQTENAVRLDIKGFRALSKLYKDVMKVHQRRYLRDNPEASSAPAPSGAEFDRILEQKLSHFSSRTNRHRMRAILKSDSPVREIFISGKAKTVQSLEALAASCKRDPQTFLPLIANILDSKSTLNGTSIISIDGSHSPVDLNGASKPDIASAQAPASVVAPAAHAPQSGVGDQERQPQLPQQPQQPIIPEPPAGDLDDLDGDDDGLIGEGDFAATLNRLSGAANSSAAGVKNEANTSSGAGNNLTANTVSPNSAAAILAQKQQRASEKNRATSREIIIQQPDAIKFLAQTICDKMGIPLPKTQWKSAMTGIATLKELCARLDEYAASGKLEV